MEPDVYKKLACFGVEQPPAWRDLINANQLCDRCCSIDWEPTSLYLSVADEYNFYPRVRLYSSHPDLRQVRDAAHAGCHLCTLILTCLLSMRYRYFISVDPIPTGLDDIGDNTLIEINVEGMARRPPVYLIISISNQGQLFGWHDMILPVVATLPGDHRAVPHISPTSDVARTWLRDCMSCHELCRSEVPRLPRRVINVSRDPLRLEEPVDRHACYATLSYTIGGAHLFTTTIDSLDRRKAGFAISDLPKTAQDAVWWARQLGLDYLWLDSLCILQDNLSDWEIELSSMADIYQNSTVTVAATRSENAHGGCLSSTNKLNMLPCQPHDGIVILADYGRKDWMFHKSVLDTRSWCFQELHLSIRVLRVGGEETAFQCRTSKRLESLPGIEMVHDIQDNLTFFGTRPLDAKLAVGQAPFKLFKLWYTMVQNFGRRDLTFPTDLLPAFSGMAHCFQGILGASYVAGLCEEDLLRGLVWRMSTPGQHAAYRAPTWSWASVRGGYLGWNVWLYDATDFEAEVLDVRVRVDGLNPYGRVSSGKLTMAGRMAPLPASLHDDESDIGPVNWRQYLLQWDRAEPPGIGSVLLRLHHRMCMIMQPIAGRSGLWTRIGSLVTAMDSEPNDRVKLTVGLLDSYEWRSAVVSVF